MYTGSAKETQAFHKKNEEARRRNKVEDLIERFVREEWNWVGYVTRKENDREIKRRRNVSKNA